MTDTTVTTATPAASSGFSAFINKVESELATAEADVLLVVQNIGAGIEVAAEDISSALTWLGNHLSGITTTITAVQDTETALNAAGVSIPSVLVTSIAGINNAVAGVNAALTNQAVAANAPSALVDGYKATKALQVAAAGAAAIAATIPISSVAPVPPQS